MTAQPKTTGASPSAPQLPVLRFSLRQSFWWMTGACFMLAALSAAPEGAASLALLLAVLVVTLHVLGTAIGNRLRAHADEQRMWEATQPRPDCLPSTPLPRPAEELRPRSPLHGRDRPLRRLPLCVVVGAVVGGLIGLAILTATIGGRSSIVGMAVGAFSTAVVGAWLAFVMANSWVIFRQGWRDAVAESRNDEPRHGSKSATLI